MPKNHYKSFRLLSIFVITLLLFACSKQPEPVTTTEPTLWQPHLLDYTQGWISAESIPHIRFSHPVISDDKIGKPIEGIIKLTPVQNIAVVFISNSELEIRHEKPFPSNQEFTVTLHPEHLQNIGNNLPILQYVLKVLEQSMNLREIGLINDSKIKNNMILEGELTVSDNVIFSAVEKTLTATQNDKKLDVSWKHINELKHQYSINGIVREQNDSFITLKWNGAAIGIKNQGDRDVSIPAKGIFSVTSVRVTGGSNPYIEARFSEALDAKQKLDGLVKLNGIDARAQIDGSILRIYAKERLQGEQKVHLESTIKNTEGSSLAQETNQTLIVIGDLPEVRFAEKGHIMPSTNHLLIPIEAMAVNAIQVKAFEVFPNNMGQYLQGNGINYKKSGYAYQQTHASVGRYLWQKKITLPVLPQSGWERYELDVSELMTNKNGSLIRLELEILPQYSTYPCDTPVSAIDPGDINNSNYEGSYQETGIPKNLQQYYKSAGYYSWNERENPCHAAYYSGYRVHGFAAQTFFASNLGMLAKQGENNTLHILISDLLTALPIENSEIAVFNYQQQAIGTGKTDKTGMLTLQLEGIPFYIQAKKGSDTNYLKVSRNEALSTSQFNTGGTKPQKGIKGFFYGERDIWRPGDDIFLTFILMDKDKTLPKHYPVTLEFFDPRNGKATTITNTNPVGSFYTFNLKTPENAPTGDWRAIIKIGDYYFDQTVRVENIAPNRLKMDMDIPTTGIHIVNTNMKTILHAQWLTGATAATLKADVQAKLSAIKTSFPGYQAYTFDDKARAFAQEPQKIFEGKLDAKGNAEVNTAFTLTEAPPGLLKATFTQRVFEPGGQFSSQYRTAPFYPFKTWVGLRSPLGEKNYYGSLNKESNHDFDLLSINSNGKPIANHKLEVTIYSINWRWWWNNDGEDFSQYISSGSHALLKTVAITTDANGTAKWTLEGKNYDWGRHLIRVCDAEENGITQHCASQDIYLGWGFGQQNTRDSATRMALSSDKEHYQVGDTVSIHLPDGQDRQVLVSIENGSRVLAMYWQDIKAKDNSFSFAITEKMTPNVYVHVTQLQAHQQQTNDLPIRQYGIVPILVDDASTHLNPILDAPEKVRPDSQLSVTVSEKNGLPMTYTLAVVDEGLLGITAFKTPDPHDHFFQREALGVSTWDLFDLVVGAYGADLTKLLKVGGSDALKSRENGRERRFPPIVRFIGPFQLQANAHTQHTIALPAYMGAVRVMVVAGNDKAYGRIEKSILVTQPLTILSTLPRVLGPGEEVSLPVNVFVSEEPVSDVKISVLTDDFFIIEKGEETIKFTHPGENIVYLKLKVKDKVGTGLVTVKAQMAGEKVQETIHIPIRSANQASTISATHVLAPGESWTSTLQQHGMLGTNTTSLLVSNVPELKLEERLAYIINYPHGCIEQTTSSVFPQLYLSQLMELSTHQKQDIQNNVNAAISRIASFQTSSGGFSYWPYENDVSPWGNNYAGHFLLEAKQLGYSVPIDMLKKWQNYQREQSKSFNSRYYSDDAYRLYTLALAGQADTGAMNRLREKFKTSNMPTRGLELWLLALAYQTIGQDNIALDLLTQAGSSASNDNSDWWWSYGSPLRDQSILLLLRFRLGQTDQAWQLASDMASQLSTNNWYSTQTTAWSLMAIANTFGNSSKSYEFALQQNNDKWQNLNSIKPIYQQTLNAYQAGKLAVKNNSTHPLYVAVSNRGIPANTTETAQSKGLTINAEFTNMKGEALAIDQLTVGQDFITNVTITNTGDKRLDNLALTQVVPSGWQIRNSRLEGLEKNSALDYLDIGDDRQVSFFSLASEFGYDRYYYWWRDNKQVGKSVTIKIIINASFAGRFYLPGWQVEPMYDGTKYASTTGKWVEVKPQ